MYKIAILGRTSFTDHYVSIIKDIPALPIVTLDTAVLSYCDALLLPGGGDITPAFFGQENTRSHHIDTELDILQIKAFDYAFQNSLPILGICKGMQLINVALGGTITQHLSTASSHAYQGKDQYHSTIIQKGSILDILYGTHAIVNSAHHQGIQQLGKDLTAIQWSCQDHCIEAIIHNHFPILGVQWHPERLDPTKTTLSGIALFRFFLFQQL